MLLLRWVINALTLFLVAKLVPGFHVDSFGGALVAALLLGLVNAVIRPIILVLTLPINILSLGLFTLLINAFMLWIVASVARGLTIDHFSSAIWGSVIIWAISLITNALFQED